MAAEVGVARACTYENKPVELSTRDQRGGAARPSSAPRTLGAALLRRHRAGRYQPNRQTPSLKRPRQCCGDRTLGGGGGRARPRARRWKQRRRAHHPNCAAARAAGAAPLRRGQPGYSPKLDRDGNGIACQ